MNRWAVFPVCAALMLCSPLRVRAQEEILIEPECQATISFYTAGVLNVHFSQDFSCCGFEVYRSTLEGELLYYSYQSGHVQQAAMMRCELKEGDYRLVLTLPSDVSNETETKEYTFTVDDPDMDIEQSFDLTEMHLFLEADDALEAEAEQHSEPVTVDRIVVASSYYTLPRRHFTPGDMNHDHDVNASDASMLLSAAAASGLGQVPLSAMQAAEADVSGDSMYTAADASLILSYASEAGLGTFEGSVLDYAALTQIQ